MELLRVASTLQGNDETPAVSGDVWYYVVMLFNAKYGSLYPACSVTDILFFFNSHIGGRG